jgi:hypothetical protein
MWDGFTQRARLVAWNVLTGPQKWALWGLMSGAQRAQIWGLMSEDQQWSFWLWVPTLLRHDLWLGLSERQRLRMSERIPPAEMMMLGRLTGPEGQSSENDDDRDDGGMRGHETIRAEPFVAPVATSVWKTGSWGPWDPERHSDWARLTPLEQLDLWARVGPVERWSYWVQQGPLDQRNLWLRMPTSEVRRTHWDLMMEMDPPGIRMSPQLGVRRQDLWGLLEEDEQRALWNRLSVPQKIDLWERLVYQNEPQQHQVWDILTDEEREDFLRLLSTHNRFDLWAHPITLVLILNWLAIIGHVGSLGAAIIAAEELSVGKGDAEPMESHSARGRTGPGPGKRGRWGRGRG